LNIFITGGSGFIGRNLIEYYSNRYTVLAPSRQELDLLDEDKVAKYFKANAIDIVVHCATKPGHRNVADPTNLVYSNCRMFFNIVRNSDQYEKMIFIGSGGVYDERYYQQKIKEDYFDAHVPVDEHGFSKYISAKYIERAENIVELRVFGIFGKYEDYAIRFISNAICKALFDLPITIKQNRRFDYLYMNDLPKIIDYFVQNKGDYKSYNVTPDGSIELLELAEKVKAVSGKDLPIKVAKPGYGSEYSGDNSRIKKQMGRLYKLTPIDKAIGELNDWYVQNKNCINREVLLFDK